MKFDSLILDFDGTLADTRDSIVITIKETLKRFGIKSVNEDEVKSLIGLTLKTTFENVSTLKGEQLDRAIKEYRLLYYKIAQKSVALFPGVKETLQALHGKDIKLAIASNKGKDDLTKLLKRLGVYSLFKYIAGEQDRAKKKPAPDIANYLIKKLDTTSGQTLVVGDTRFDVVMGKAAGCPTCAVTYGYHTKKELLEESPDFIIDCFTELLRII